MAYGDRDVIQFSLFRGIEPQRTHIWPEVYAAQEVFAEGILPVSVNLAFSEGRAYWRRNRLYVPMPSEIAETSSITKITRLERQSDIVTATTNTPHCLAVGNYVYIYATGSANFSNGWFEVLSVPSATTFTYAEDGSDASIAPTACKAYPNCVRNITIRQDVSSNYLLIVDANGQLWERSGLGIFSPSQWTYGYSVPSGTWTKIEADFVNDDWLQRAYIDVARLPDKTIYILGGGNWPYGGGCCCYDGEQTMTVGLEPVHKAPSGVADSSAPSSGSNALAPGLYSYYVAFYNEHFESMRDDTAILDVEVNGQAATGYIKAAGSSNVQHGDYVEVGGQRYTFITTSGLSSEGRTVRAGDVWVGATIKDSIRNLYQAMANGATITDNTVAPATAYTPPCANVVVSLSLDSTQIDIEAAEEGTDGNNITLAENTSGNRLVVSGSTLSGGLYYHHIDLSSIPTSYVYSLQTGWTLRGRKIYRAYSPDAAVRGTDWRLLVKIDDMTTTTYEDNTPQEYLSSYVDYDYAMPPRGNTIAVHRGRVWIGGILRTSPSYDVVIPLASASRVDNVFTGTTTTAHGLNVGDNVFITGCFGPYEATYSVVSERVSATQFRCAWTGSNASSSGAGHIRRNLGVYKQMQNAIAYSEPGPTLYWPAENIIHIGGYSPVIRLISFYDELLIFKQDGVFVLTGDTESDMRVQRLSGASGCISPGIAVGPQAVIWAGHSGWEMYDGRNVVVLLRYSEIAQYENEMPAIARPINKDATGSSATSTTLYAAAYHNGRYYLVSGNGEYCYVFENSGERGSWECQRLNVGRPGLFPFTTTSSSFIACCIDWADNGKNYLTYLDIATETNNPPNNVYADGQGTQSTNYANIYMELPPLIAPIGDVIQPLEFWVRGSWTLAASVDDRPHLWLSLGEDEEWIDIGEIVANKCLHFPSGYMGSRVRLAIKANYAPFFVVHSITVAFQRRRERANA